MQVALLGQAPPLTRLTQPEQKLYVALPALCPLLLLESTLLLTVNTTQTAGLVHGHTWRNAGHSIRRVRRWSKTDARVVSGEGAAGLVPILRWSAQTCQGHLVWVWRLMQMNVTE